MANNLVIVANYNQIMEIEKYLQNLSQYFSKNQVIVVDDGSTDGSAEIAEKLGFKVLRHEKNRGIGAAIRTGLKYAMDNRFFAVLISSSNGKMVPAEFQTLLNLLNTQPIPYIQGSRFMHDGHFDQMPRFRRLMIPVMSLLWSLIFGQRMTDITCGLRAYKVELLNDPRINLNQEWLDRYEMEYYLHIKFLRILKTGMVEVPVTIRYGHLAKNRLSKIKPFVGWWSMARPFVFLLLGIKK